jgi:hypothetical protein
MSARLRKFLESFDELDNSEQRQAASVILQRTVAMDSPPLTDDDLVSMAEELFLRLDAEEAADEASKSR